MKHIIATAIVAATTIGMSACSTQENTMEYEQRVEQVAAAARTDIDALAAQVGTNPDIRQDVNSDCLPGNANSGKSLNYTIHVTVNHPPPTTKNRSVRRKPTTTTRVELKRL